MTRLIPLFVLGCTLPHLAFAQTLVHVVAKVVDYEQTDAGTTSFNSSIGHTFNAEVIDNGGTLNASNPSNAPFVDDNSTNWNLAWDTTTNSWRYEDSGYASASALDAVYADTAYDFNYDDGGGYDVGTVTFSTDLYPNIPEATFTAGHWSGGAFVIDAATTFTIATNTFSTHYSGGAGDHVSIYISGPGFDDSVTMQSDSASLLINGSSLTAGQSYEVTLNFTNSFDSADLDGDSTDDTFASYATITTFTLTAVPEPGAWGLWCGVAALAWVTGQRRRRPAC